MSVSAVKAGRAFIELFADMTGLERGLAKARGKLMAFSRSVSSLGLGAIKIGASIAAPLAAIGAMAVKASGDFESTSIALTALIGDADKARSILAEADKYAATTHFGLLDVTDSIRSLKGYQVATEDVMRVTKMLGDISAASQVPLKELAEVYGRNSQQGSVLTKDIREFSSRGIPVMTHLQKKFGDVWKAASEGRIVFADIDEALRKIASKGEWGGMAETLSGTLNGQLSIAFDQIMLVARAVGDVMLPTVKIIVAWLIKYSGVVTDLVKRNQGLVTTVVIAAAVVAGAATALAAAGIAATGLAAGVAFLAPLLSVAALKIALIAAAATGLAYIFREQLATAFKWVAQAAADNFGWIADTFGVAWGGIAKAIEAGDFERAFAVAMLGARAILADGLARGLTVWAGYKGAVVDLLAAMAAASVDVVSGMLQGFLSMQAAMLRGVADMASRLGPIGRSVAEMFNRGAMAADASGAAAGLAGSGIKTGIGAAAVMSRGEDNRLAKAAADAAAELKKELAKSVGKKFFDESPIAKKIEDAAAKSGGGPDGGAAASGPSKSVFGTFSSMGIRAGVGNSIANRTAIAAEKTAENTRRLLNKDAVFE